MAGWNTCSVQEGGQGKTRAGSNWLWWRAVRYPGSENLVLSGTYQDLLHTVLNGSSGIFNTMPQKLIASYSKNEMLITLKNGSKIKLISVEQPERIRGGNHFAIWADETAGWGRTVADEAYRLAKLALRAGDNPQMLITSTPKANALFNMLHRKWVEGSDDIILRQASSYDNPHLAENFEKTLIEFDVDSPFSRAEIYGQILDPSEQSYFPRSKLKLWPSERNFPVFERIFASLDCAFSEKAVKNSSYTACVIAGIFRPHEDSPNCLMIIDVWRDRLGYPDLLEKLQEIHESSFGGDDKGMGGKRIDLMLIEDAAAGKSLLQSLRRLGHGVHGMKTGSIDKVERAAFASSVWHASKIYAPESQVNPGKPRTWLNDYLNEITTFPNTPMEMGETVVHNDFVDATSHLLNYCYDQGLIKANTRVNDWRRPIPYESDLKEHMYAQ